jgi:hypothetical protein
MAKMRRRQLRQMILEQMAVPQIDPDIQRMANEIQAGTIIDLSEMEGAGGGRYPVYKVVGGQAMLSIEDLGGAADLGIADMISQFADMGREADMIMSSVRVFMYPDATALKAMGY